jgi:formylglycine-generating enzyme required for sulfatase activity
MGSATGEGGQTGGIDQRLVTISSAFYLGTIEVTQQQYEAVMKKNPSDRRWLGPQMPVQCVTWDEANEFCRRLSQAEGRHYRLPTSAEWEYACRAGSTAPFGDLGSLDAVGWYTGNSGGAIHPAGGKQPNVWGFYDVHGNVAEWCSDIPAPTPPQSLAIIRGGSALRSAMDCRSAAYSLASINGRFSDVGFRVALDP